MSVQIMVNAKFWPLFLTEITVKSTNHEDIRDQQAKIYKNPCFVFDFTSLDFLTGFPTVILTGVDDVESWNAIRNLAMRLSTQIINFKKIGSKLWPWECAPGEWIFGRCDVIKYANELNHKRAQLDH